MNRVVGEGMYKRQSLNKDKSMENRIQGVRVTVLVLAVLLLTSATSGVALLPRDFDLADYASEEDPSGTWTWRGYTFKVTQPVCVTALYGGVSGVGVWNIALYEVPDMDMLDKTADELLAHGALSSNERFSRVDIDPVLLFPGQPYMIAQGRETSAGFHHRVSEIDTNALVAGETHIKAWGPMDGNTYRVSQQGPVSVPLTTAVDPVTDHNPPHIGFKDSHVVVLPGLPCLQDGVP